MYSCLRCSQKFLQPLRLVKEEIDLCPFCGSVTVQKSTEQVHRGARGGGYSDCIAGRRRPLGKYPHRTC